MKAVARGSTGIVANRVWHFKRFVALDGNCGVSEGAEDEVKKDLSVVYDWCATSMHRRNGVNTPLQF